MADDRDLVPLLPDEPPPRPSGRAAAIEAALLRFDGRHQARRPAVTERPALKPWTGWPQISALTAAALVLVVSASVWRSAGERGLPIPRTEDAADIAQNGAASEESNAALSEVTIGPEPTLPAAKETAPRVPTSVSETNSLANEKAQASQKFARIAPVSSPVPAGVLASAPPPPAPPPAAAPAQHASRGVEGGAMLADDSSIVVTGSMVSSDSRASSAGLAPKAHTSRVRGDWNACTIDDPSEDVNECGQSHVSGSKGIAQGLTQAWKGDLEGAIGAFSEAIRQDGTQALAYLNRGLAFARRGDLRRGVADLNRAVSAAPRDARSYYHRSLLLARHGDSENARADALRALRLDPAYREVIR